MMGAPAEDRPQPGGAGAPPLPVVVLRLFAAARQAAGTGRVEIEAATVAEAIQEAQRRFGETLGRVAASSRVWVNGSAADPGTVLVAGDEVAILPPVSGGAGSGAPRQHRAGRGR